MVSRQWLAGRTIVRITATTAENQLLRRHWHCYYYVSRAATTTEAHHHLFRSSGNCAFSPNSTIRVEPTPRYIFFGCHEEDGIRRGEQRGATRTREQTACVNIGESSFPRGWLAVVEFTVGTGRVGTLGCWHSRSMLDDGDDHYTLVRWPTGCL